MYSDFHFVSIKETVVVEIVSNHVLILSKVFLLDNTDRMNLEYVLKKLNEIRVSRFDTEGHLCIGR